MANGSNMPCKKSAARRPRKADGLQHPSPLDLLYPNLPHTYPASGQPPGPTTAAFTRPWRPAADVRFVSWGIAARRSMPRPFRSAGQSGTLCCAPQPWLPRNTSSSQMQQSSSPGEGVNVLSERGLTVALKAAGLPAAVQMDEPLRNAVTEVSPTDTGDAGPVSQHAYAAGLSVWSHGWCSAWLMSAKWVFPIDMTVTCHHSVQGMSQLMSKQHA